MAPKATLLSIVSLFFINHSNAQTGEGCFFPQCPTLGQVRMDAIKDAAGNFLGGCNCGCPNALYDPSSPLYCAPPKQVNFDEVRRTGDCSCTSPPNSGYTQPQPATTQQTPQQPPPPVTTLYTAPIQTTQNIHSGHTLPAPTPRPSFTYSFPAPPTTKAPTPFVATGPNVPATVYCDTLGPCSCPPGTHGTCTITCDGHEGCKDAIIDCNNMGFPCIVDCMGEGSCMGATTVNGPAHGPLTVHCTGEKACEGHFVVNGEVSTDLRVNFEGPTAGKGAILNFGVGAHEVGCYGEPGVTDTCQDLTFNLPPNAITTPGMAFFCDGLTCPPNTPEPFSNLFGAQSSTCSKEGDCGCNAGTSDVCTVDCITGTDACKDGTIRCNNDGFDCIVNCMSESSCSGSTTIIGPVGGRLTVNCHGLKSCEGATVFDGAQSTDMTVICLGNEACKGSVTLNFGTGEGRLECHGTPDSCVGSPIFNMQAGPNAAFSCGGVNCPPEAPAAFGNTGNWPINPPATTEPNQPTATNPQPQNTGNNPAIPANPGPANPGPANPGNVVQPNPVTPQTRPPVVQNMLCCQTAIQGFKPWQGRCWGLQTIGDCQSEPNQRCVWEPNNCMTELLCSLRDVPCDYDNECCSEVCIGGTGQTIPAGQAVGGGPGVGTCR